jgi:diadenosine tetraphosphate (Ap4A) HIT family hydrolase
MDACHPQPAEVPAPKLTLPGCPLCDADGGHLVARLPVCRVIRADEPGFPALYRVVLNEHVAEWSDVSDADQADVMRVVNTVERVLRELLHPAKINLAALGNVVPHVHWHVIARFDWDSHFPAPIWAQPQRAVEPGQLSVVSQLLPRVDDVLRQRLLPS